MPKIGEFFDEGGEPQDDEQKGKLTDVSLNSSK
jgi:hypothetical protein